MNEFNIDMNLSEICRLCLIRGSDMIPIFESSNIMNLTALPTKIMTCVSIEVTAGDGLPELVCQKCVLHIDSWYRFKNQCQNTDATLREFLKKQRSYNNRMAKSISSEHKTLTERKINNGSMTRAIEKVDSVKQIEENAKDPKELINLLVKRDDKDVPLYAYLPGLEMGVKFKVKLEEGDEKTIQDENNLDFTSNIPINESFACKVCHKSFCNKYYLRDHEAIHSGEQDFCCSDCGKAFYSKNKLIVHMKTHSAERPFLCSVCGKAYRKKFDLKRHILMHSDESPFLCNVCGKTFKTKFNLTHHFLAHSGEKKYMCAECGKAFTYSETLRAHAKVHLEERPITCTVCGKGFKRKEHLVRHMRVHTVEKPFVCPHCMRCFTGKWNLTQHIRLHTGQKPYVCSLCGDAFTHNVTLKNHFKLQHAQNK